MIQLRALREFIPEGQINPVGFDKPFSPDLYAETHEEIISGDFLDKIPTEEKWNVFMTVSHTKIEQKKRQQEFQSALFFDIDKIDTTRKEDYIPAIEKALLLEAKDILILCSGNGLHVLIQTSTLHLKAQKDYALLKPLYTLVCGRIDSVLKSMDLPGTADTQAFSPNRMVRMPGTKNRKPGKEEKDVILMTDGFKELPLDLKFIAMGEVPHVSEEDQAKGDFSWRTLDSATVQKECRFLSYAKENPQKISEPQWYAALGFLGRLPEGEALCHEYSKGHPGYTEHGTTLKMNQALQASAPRTCTNVSTLFAGCKECPHFGQVTNPLSLKGEAFVATAENGFYTKTEGGRLSPNYGDLRKFFANKHTYRVHRDTLQVYIFDQTHYKEYAQSELRNFADINFKPTPRENVAREFVSWITRSELIDETWFKKTHSLINFKNGVLDTKTKNILAHSPEFGFLYCLPFDYDPYAKCPTFDKFMTDITEDNKDLAQLILEFIGYALCDREYWIQKAMVFVGRGANGKTTLLKVIEMLAGEKNFSAISMNDFQNENHRSQLEGKLLNICDELPISTVKNTEMFKKLMGGTVTIRRLYQNPKIITNLAKFFFSCNELPDIYDRSEGLFRRLILVPFEAHFTLEKGTADPAIVKKLSWELPGIFNKVFGAYMELKARGHISKSEASLDEFNLFKDNINWVEVWLNETFEVTEISEEVFVPTKIVYEKYSTECQQSGEKPLPRRRFFSLIKNMLPHFKKRYTRKYAEDGRQRVILGLSVRGTEKPTIAAQM